MFTPSTGKSRDRFTKVRHRYGRDWPKFGTRITGTPSVGCPWIAGEDSTSHTLSVSDKLITESPMSHCPETGFEEINGDLREADF